jgi:hypothetical protein
MQDRAAGDGHHRVKTGHSELAERIAAPAGDKSSRTGSARAMHRRCCWPPDRPRAEVCSRSLTSLQSAARVSDHSTRSSIAERDSRSRSFSTEYSNNLVVEEARVDVSDTDQRHRRPVRQVQRYNDIEVRKHELRIKRLSSRMIWIALRVI